MHSLRTYKAFRIGLAWFAVAILMAVSLVYMAGRGAPPKRDVRDFNGVNTADQAATLTLSYNSGLGQMQGDLTTSPNCSEDRFVTLILEPQSGSGAGSPIGGGQTEEDGSFSFAFPPIPGTFHAEVGSVTRAPDTCLGATSNSVTIP